VPCYGGFEGDAKTNRERNDPASIANVNQALVAIADRIPHRVSFVPWTDAICPGGKFATKVDGVVVRPDGVHVGNIAGAQIIAGRIAPLIGDLARKARAARETSG
jgi:hypothetical protein